MESVPATAVYAGMGCDIMGELVLVWRPEQEVTQN